MLFFEFKNKNETKYIFFLRDKKTKMFVHKKNGTLASLVNTEIIFSLKKFVVNYSIFVFNTLLESDKWAKTMTRVTIFTSVSSQNRPYSVGWEKICYLHIGEVKNKPDNINISTVIIFRGCIIKNELNSNIFSTFLSS